MNPPHVGRPKFPEGYVETPRAFVPWSHVEERLADASNYWLCTVRPNGQPHSIPKWGVWVNRRVYFDGSPETRHARNLVGNPHVTLHLESADDVVIVEGIARPITSPSPELAAKIAKAFSAKYKDKGYSPEPTQWDNVGLFEILPRIVIAWTSFVDDPTKFTLDHDEDQQA